MCCNSTSSGTFTSALHTLPSVRAQQLTGSEWYHEGLQGLTAAVHNHLRLAGWTSFVGGKLMSCDYTAVAAGQTCQAEVVQCAVELLGPASAMLVVTSHREAFCHRLCVPLKLQLQPVRSRLHL